MEKVCLNEKDIFRNFKFSLSSTSLCLLQLFFFFNLLSFRFNCGTGAAQIVSESRVVVGQWHTVSVFRDGMSGWLRMDNDNPISGRSQVSHKNDKNGSFCKTF